MDTNTISNDCNAFNGGTSSSDYGSVGFSGGLDDNGNLTTVSEPTTLALFGLGMAGLGVSRHRRGGNKQTSASD